MKALMFFLCFASVASVAQEPGDAAAAERLRVAVEKANETGAALADALRELAIAEQEVRAAGLLTRVRRDATRCVAVDRTTNDLMDLDIEADSPAVAGEIRWRYDLGFVCRYEHTPITRTYTHVIEPTKIE